MRFDVNIDDVAAGVALRRGRAASRALIRWTDPGVSMISIVGTSVVVGIPWSRCDATSCPGEVVGLKLVASRKAFEES